MVFEWMDRSYFMVFYIAPENSVFYSKTDKTNGIIRLENALNDILGQYGEMPIFLTNSRTASEPDFMKCKDDNLLGLAGNFYMGDSFDIERKSKNKIVNNYGISLLYVQIVYYTYTQW